MRSKTGALVLEWILFQPLKETFRLKKCFHFNTRKPLTSLKLKCLFRLQCSCQTRYDDPCSIQSKLSKCWQQERGNQIITLKNTPWAWYLIIFSCQVCVPGRAGGNVEGNGTLHAQRGNLRHGVVVVDDG